MPDDHPAAEVGTPPPERLAALVKRIHAHRLQMVLAVTGGGSQALSTLLTVSGASRTVLEATVPYSLAALTNWLGATPEHACSNRTARAMAMVAWQRARHWRQLGTEPAELAGVACTASLASDHPKRGPHRIHAACQTSDATISCDVELMKGARSRREEEELAMRLILNLIASLCDCGETALDLQLHPGESLVRHRTAARPEWRRLLAGESGAVLSVAGQPTARLELPLGCPAPPPSRAIFPGAFNPLHAGHREMIDVAASRLGQAVELELSVTNVDKPPLDYFEIESRLAQLPAEASMWLTAAPTFLEKAVLFPGATFVVGIDTLMRIADRRYYGDDWGARDRALREIAAAGCRFLVFGRLVGDRFQSLHDAALPTQLAERCTAVEASEFRRDVSSTELRRTQPPG